MDLLYIIPARGGSKGIPRKNVKKLNGKPLIQHSIELARSLTADENICISTDDPEIIFLSESTGIKVPFTRPAELASDSASMQDVLMHAISFYKEKKRIFEAMVLLQPTSPIRNADDIKNAVSAFSPEIDMVMSVKETKANPYFVLFEEEQGFLVKSKEGDFTTRQSAPPVFQANGSIYVINVKSLEQKPMREFKKVKKFLMDEIKSTDIDTPLDWVYCEFLFERGYVK